MRYNLGVTELNRIQFLEILAGGAALLFSGACRGPRLPDIQTPYTVGTLQKLGKELNEWKLADGTLMAGRFPEIKKATDLLSGTLDPAQYFPFIKVPIGFSILAGSDMAALAMQRIPDPNDARKIAVTTKEGQLFNAPILARNTPVEIAVSQDVLDSSIRLPVLVKETSQLLDYPDYARAYVNYLKATYGINFTLSNPDNIPTSENEVMTSIVNNTALERTLTGRERFRIFVDNGSFLRSAIAFTNWYADQLRLGLKPEGKLVVTGLHIRNFLTGRGLIKQEGNLFVWNNGKAPEINDPKFLELVNAISTGN